MADRKEIDDLISAAEWNAAFGRLQKLGELEAAIVSAAEKWKDHHFPPGMFEPGSLPVENSCVPIADQVLAMKVNLRRAFLARARGAVTDGP